MWSLSSEEVYFSSPPPVPLIFLSPRREWDPCSRSSAFPLSSLPLSETMFFFFCNCKQGQPFLFVELSVRFLSSLFVRKSDLSFP